MTFVDDDDAERIFAVVFGEKAGVIAAAFIAIDAQRIAGQDHLTAAVNEVIDNLHGSERVDPAQGVLYPGENSLAIRTANLRDGIPVDDGVWAKIKSL